MKRIFLLMFLYSAMVSSQRIKFDAANKWVLPLGRNSESVQQLKHPLRIEYRDHKLKLYYPDLNKFYYKELVTPIKSITEIDKDGRTYYLLEYDHDGLTYYFRITKDNDPNYGVVYGIEIPVIENGQIIEYDTFY